MHFVIGAHQGRTSRSRRIGVMMAVPACLDWSVERVGEWLESIGFSQYRETFNVNGVSGRRLVWINSSNLPQMGITDWTHIQIISKGVRELLGIEEPQWNRSITLPHSPPLTTFLLQKSFTGHKSNQLQFKHPQ